MERTLTGCASYLLADVAKPYLGLCYSHTALDRMIYFLKVYHSLSYDYR